MSYVIGSVGYVVENTVVVDNDVDSTINGE